MLHDLPLIDAHVHAPHLATLKPAWIEWAKTFGRGVPLDTLYAPDGRLIPERFDDYMEQEGVDTALLLCEYSPKATGIQPIEDLLPLVAQNPRRFRLLANLNPHFHFPLVEELKRQVALGAVGLKLHTVHGGFSANDATLYPVYAYCEQERLPVMYHCGTSTFAGGTNRFADPLVIEDVARDFPALQIVLAHGGRGWWYDAAGFLALMRQNVWIEVSGLPPKKLPEYYARYDFARLARRMIFGTDWPGVPGIRNNAEALATLGLDAETLRAIYAGNARLVYRLDAS